MLDQYFSVSLKSGFRKALSKKSFPSFFLNTSECRDDSVVERAKFKEYKYRLGEATPRRPSYRRGVIPKQTVDSLAKLKAWSFDYKKAAVIGSIKAVWKTLKSSG
jgi:hypothetical protein